MGFFKIGDIVTRKSYGSDILFKITEVISRDGENIAILKGITCRLAADAPESDLLLHPARNSSIAKKTAKSCSSAEEKTTKTYS